MSTRKRDPMEVAEERIAEATRRGATSLDLSRLKLTALPPGISRIASLTRLDLSDNQLANWPAEVERLINLRQLDLGDNRLAALPEGLGPLPHLRQLVLSRNRLTGLPAAFQGLARLQKLYIRGNQLAALPEPVCRLTALKALSLGGNRLAALPEAVGQITSLTTLDLSGNQLADLPAPFWRLTRLESLDLSNNELSALGADIHRLRNLQELVLRGNRLAALPQTIGRLSRLERLDLSDNRLAALPQAIGQLTGLRTLDLSGNGLASLPDGLAQLRFLEQLYLHGNELLALPPEILGGARYEFGQPPGRPSRALSYYFRGREAARPLNEAKLVLVGRGEVGKTSLVNRLIRDAFNPAEPKTHGIRITPWLGKRRDETIKLRVWDFGGQEIMHATHQFFLTERSLYVLVLNGRQGQEDAEAEYWLNLVRNFGGDSPVLVVLNKIAQHPFDVNRGGLQARFPNIKGFFRTDCAEKVGLDELRRAIAREVSALPHVRSPFPATWFRIKERLEQLAEGRENYITYERFREVCSELGEKDANAQDSLAGTLHALGVALNYRDDPRLNDRHVLNPRWVTEGIYALLNSPLAERQQGVLSPNDLAAILDATQYPRTVYRFLLELMRKFDICFELPDRPNHYLLPELLGKQEPAGLERFVGRGCLNFEYRYAALPEGLLPRFIARTHWHSEGRPRWRGGVVLGFDGCEALVRGDGPRRRASIRVAGPDERRRQLLAIIRSEFDRLHADFRANPPEAFVPLPGHPDAEPIPYRDLLVCREQNDPTIKVRVGNTRKEFNVSELLNGVDLPGPGRRGGEGVRVFLSYSHRDETHKAVLCGHILPLVQEGVLAWWDDRHLRPGDDWAGEIDHNLDRAEFIILLVSRHFLASSYCSGVEVPRAVKRQQVGEAAVLPVVLDDSPVGGQPYMVRQSLLPDAKPVLSADHWPNPNDAWRLVAANLREAARRWRAR